jgi:hypothetical protein
MLLEQLAKRRKAACKVSENKRGKGFIRQHELEHYLDFRIKILQSVEPL